MAGRLDGQIIVGDVALTEEILDALASAGEFPIAARVFPSFASSDNMSFSEVGVPSVTITSGDDPAIHTSEDAVGWISVAALETMLGIVDVVLGSVAPGNPQ